MTLADTTPVNSLFACSMKVCPEDTSTNFDSLHLGQSSQPSPEPVSLTSAPVKMMTHRDPRAIPQTIRYIFGDTRATNRL